MITQFIHKYDSAHFQAFFAMIKFITITSSDEIVQN